MTPNILQISNIKIDKIFQTEIADKNADKLCLWMQDILIPWSILRIIAKQSGKDLAPLSLADFNRLNDECIKNGGLAKLTEGDSKEGFVNNHELCANAVGLYGYQKEYVKIPTNKDGTFDSSFAFNLLQWGCLIELRDEGHHSLTATGAYKVDGKFYFEVRDPWPKTDDTRFDCARAMTQRFVNGQWIDSRSIEYFGWFFKIGVNPKWI